MGAAKMTEWFEHHPIIIAFLAIGLMYLVSWGRVVDFIGGLAIFAFGEMAILWATVTTIRKKVEELERRNESLSKQGEDAIAALWERVHETSERSRSLDTRMAACEKIVGSLLSQEVKGAS